MSQFRYCYKIFPCLLRFEIVCLCFHTYFFILCSVVHMACDHVPVELAEVLRDKRYTCPTCRRLNNLRRIARIDVSDLSDNRFEISVRIVLLLHDLPLLVERVSVCSLQIIAFKLVCLCRYCYKICPC